MEWNESATTYGVVTLTNGTTLEQQIASTTSVGLAEPGAFNWSFISVLVFVVAGTLGNVLVCLAVWLERPLQNVTNWFLVSLAFADLIVSTIVMPFGATAGFLGNSVFFPLESSVRSCLSDIGPASFYAHLNAHFLSLICIPDPLKTLRTKMRLG